MTHAIVGIPDISQLFADLAPLYVARANLELWLAKYDLVIVKTEDRYRIMTFYEHKFITEVDYYAEYPSYGEALVVALDECVARAKAK